MLWELCAILSQRNTFTSSVSSSSCSASDPHTHCPSTDLYTPNYTQQPPDSIHISPHMQNPRNTHIRKAAVSKPDQLCLCLSSCQARNEKVSFFYTLLCSDLHILKQTKSLSCSVTMKSRVTMGCGTKTKLQFTIE